MACSPQAVPVVSDALAMSSGPRGCRVYFLFSSRLSLFRSLSAYRQQRRRLVRLAVRRSDRLVRRCICRCRRRWVRAVALSRYVTFEADRRGNGGGSVTWLRGYLVLALRGVRASGVGLSSSESVSELVSGDESYARFGTGEVAGSVELGCVRWCWNVTLIHRPV